ncbi:MAG: hypothetical protein I3273_02085 [Candidatus Moeniiplasma glomeromycotorum]|nr:hypothetical protein [Candidatus Moeniiplasma glomeromycotorum]MCE8167091.1 hypothetical protein [Candidatus Moeniiplasma glomeromycotorum]MCE8168897.1 hypothetical protein [Candidatus Moeniiplasma glomeromycotorum]
MVLIGSILVGGVSIGVLYSLKTSPPSKEKNPENLPLPPESKDCPYLKEANLTTANSETQKKLKMTLTKKELAQWKTIPPAFVFENWKKGYHWHDIIQLWEWKISSVDIPDLKSEQRVGVINGLTYLFGLPASILYDKSIPQAEKLRMMKDDSVSGFSRNLVVIIRKKSPNDLSLNLDKKFPGASPYGNTRQYIQSVITLFSQQEKVNLSQYQISLLECLGVEYFNQEADIKNGISYGKSTGSAIYLALLSALHKKSLSRSVTATGYITTKKKKVQLNGQTIDLISGANLPIGGIKGKVIGALKKGIDKLVLSKFQSSPFIFLWNKKKSEWVEQKDEDYQKVVPAETQARIKKVYWTENISQLRDLVLEGKLS